MVERGVRFVTRGGEGAGEVEVASLFFHEVTEEEGDFEVAGEESNVGGCSLELDLVGGG